MTTTASKKRSLRFHFASRQLIQVQRLHWSAMKIIWRLQHSRLQLTDKTGLTTLIQLASLSQMQVIRYISRQKLTTQLLLETNITTCSSLLHNQQRKSMSLEMLCRCLHQNSARWDQLILIASTGFSPNVRTYLTAVEWPYQQHSLLTTATTTCSLAALPWQLLLSYQPQHLPTTATTTCSLNVPVCHKLQPCQQQHLLTAATQLCSPTAYHWQLLLSYQPQYLLTAAIATCSLTVPVCHKLQPCQQHSLLTTATHTCSRAALPWLKLQQ